MFRGEAGSMIKSEKPGEKIEDVPVARPVALESPELEFELGLLPK